MLYYIFIKCNKEGRTSSASKTQLKWKQLSARKRKKGQRLVGEDVGIEAELGSSQGGEVLHTEEELVSWTTINEWRIGKWEDLKFCKAIKLN